MLDFLNRNKLTILFIVVAVFVVRIIFAPKPQQPSRQSIENVNSLDLSAQIGDLDRTQCLIKGNISYKTGEKIYHTPDCPYYYQTKINEDYGERWFCTETDAKAAGWRKAYNCP